MNLFIRSFEALQSYRLQAIVVYFIPFDKMERVSEKIGFLGHWLGFVMIFNVPYFPSKIRFTSSNPFKSSVIKQINSLYDQFMAEKEKRGEK